MVGRGFSSIFWGILADRIGRKPVIAFSILSVYVLQKFQVSDHLGFGFLY